MATSHGQNAPKRFHRDTNARQNYPTWDWFDGAIWEIRAGVDYTCATETARRDLYFLADQEGVKVRTRRITEDYKVVGLYIQAFQRNGDPIQP